MCRLFGTFGPRTVDVMSMTDACGAQYHGGPDEQSILIRPTWALGSNRLAIQGIKCGGQPYIENCNIHVIFNGEIYNHHDLRLDLISRGHSITNDCDGALLPALYIEYGEKFIEKLDGMFAVAIVDTRSSPRLLLACDHLGIKSLYYSIENQQINFASELSGLLALDRSIGAYRVGAIDLYLSMLAVLGRKTIYKNVYTLEPGSILSIELGERMAIQQPRSRCAQKSFPSLSVVGDQLREMLDYEVSRMVKADVPTCAVVSGGLDSSLVSALAASQTTSLTGFHLSYRGEWPQDERKFARDLADSCGMELRVVDTDPDTFSDLLPKVVHHLGQPNAAPHALSTYLLFREVAHQGFKVAITGEGADEQFGGYARFLQAQADQDDSWWLTYLDKMAAIPRSLREKLYTAEFTESLRTGNPPYYDITKKISGFSRINRLSEILEFDLYDRFPYYILRRVDHLSMAHSVEVRVPFCQPMVTQFAEQLSGRFKISNSSVKRAVYEAGRQLVPPSILRRPKQPFTLPVDAMIRPGQRLFTFIGDLLTTRRFAERGLFRSDEVERLIRSQKERPDKVVAKSLWALAILELWFLQQVSVPGHQETALMQTEIKS